MTATMKTPSLLSRLLSWIAGVNDRHRAIRQLNSLDDYLLKDMGIERYQIPEVVEWGLERVREQPELAARKAPLEQPCPPPARLPIATCNNDDQLRAA